MAKATPPKQPAPKKPDDLDTSKLQADDETITDPQGNEEEEETGGGTGAGIEIPVKPPPGVTKP